MFDLNKLLDKYGVMRDIHTSLLIVSVDDEETTDNIYTELKQRITDAKYDMDNSMNKSEYDYWVYLKNAKEKFEILNPQIFL